MRQDWSQTIYDKLVNEEDARACKAISDEACQQVPGNFIRIIFSQFLSKLGDALLNPKITLPWLLQSLGSPAFLLAWLVPIRESGSLLPQLAIASWVRTLALRKWVWVLGSVLQAISVLAMGLVAISLDGAAAGWSIIGCLVVLSLARGLCSVAAKDVLGKTIPKQQRGQVTGWSASAAGLITLALGVSLWWGQDAAAVNDAHFLGWVLMAAAAVWLLAATLFSTIDEYSGAVDGGENGFKRALAQLTLLQSDEHFRRFVIVRSLFLCSALSAPYYVMLAYQQSSGELGSLALFVIASGIASLVSAPIWGRFADWSSLKVMQLAAMLSALCGGVLLLLILLLPSWLHWAWVLPGLYFFLSISHQGVRVGRKTYLVDLASGNQRTSYVAVSNTLIGVILLLFSAVGALTHWLSVAGIIAIFSALAIVGVIVSRRLPEV
ncbi:MFS transporter [Bacterioplanes sanyensis]|uniref:MFS transporter n=1 Tax=Bacterioplanes sanyensis TaxID=1249553 RepID=A0A222FET6_9GAMM|nr:MFS transporter [Bacterioplanes sanyensis]ASP37587.1 MFS transporter [Bacterioplanes sanyensis]